jgi:diguanylate cyclase (GGDEF)-like protein
MGGDEFVLVLPDSSVTDTLKRMEQIHLLVSQMQVQFGEQQLGKITISAGIAPTHTGEATAADLLCAADQALYAAKLAGRDQTAIYEGPLNKKLPQAVDAKTPGRINAARKPSL